jgi:deoxycytidylate deaminase
MDAKIFLAEIRVHAQAVRRRAEKNQICKRKSVGSVIVEQLDSLTHYISPDINGPIHPSIECTNEVGNCGCAHAEPKIIMAYLKNRKKQGPTVLYSTYTPCTPCAHLIIGSGVIDLVVWEIDAPHWARAEEMLRAVLPVYKLHELTEEILRKCFTQ